MKGYRSQDVKPGQEVELTQNGELDFVLPFGVKAGVRNFKIYIDVAVLNAGSWVDVNEPQWTEGGINVDGYPGETEWSYDDGTAEGVWQSVKAGSMFSVQFDNTARGSSVSLVGVRFYVDGFMDISARFRVHVLDENRKDLTSAIDGEFSQILTNEKLYAYGYHYVNLENAIDISSLRTFFIALEAVPDWTNSVRDPSSGTIEFNLGEDSDVPLGRSWEVTPSGQWEKHIDVNFMIRAVVRLGTPQPTVTATTEKELTTAPATYPITQSATNAQLPNFTVVFLVALAILVPAAYVASRRARRPSSIVEAKRAGLFDISVGVPSVGKTVTLEAAPDHTVGSLVETLISTINIPKDKRCVLDYAGKLIGQQDFGKSLAALGIKEGSKLSLRVVE